MARHNEASAQRVDYSWADEEILCVNGGKRSEDKRL